MLKSYAGLESIKIITTSPVFQPVIDFLVLTWRIHVVCETLRKPSYKETHSSTQLESEGHNHKGITIIAERRSCYTLATTQQQNSGELFCCHATA